MRAGCVSGLSNDVFISGSYDHTVKVWDARKGDDGSAAFMTLDHGSPVEDVALLPNDALLVSAGGHEVKVRIILPQPCNFFKIRNCKYCCLFVK